MLTIKARDPESSETRDLLSNAITRLLVHSREKIFIKDKNLVYRAASQKFANMAGWESAGQLIGKTDFEVFEDQDLAQHYRDDDLRLIERQHDFIDYVEPITEKDGHPRYASTSKYVLKDENGHFIGIAGVSRDVTNEYYMKRHSNPALQYLFDLPENVYFAIYMDLEEWRIVNEHHQMVNGHEFAAHANIEHLITTTAKPRTTRVE